MADCDWVYDTDAPIIGIRRLLRWYRPNVVYTIGKCSFWATVSKTVRPMLSDHCLSCLTVPSVCNVGALWPNGWMDQGAT